MPGYLNQADAIKVDEELISRCGFRIEQLVELAGMSCAVSITECYKAVKKILVVCGPGNNGCDGLVCARHLKLFGYIPEVYLAKRGNKVFYAELIKQCEGFEIPMLSSSPDAETINSSYELVVDALFGFSFKPPVRPELANILRSMIQCAVPVVSIDIPSGWDVERGPVDPGDCLNPEMLISLTAPKLCAKVFRGKHHFLAGRFMPEPLATKYNLSLPTFQSTDCWVRLT